METPNAIYVGVHSSSPFSLVITTIGLNFRLSVAGRYSGITTLRRNLYEVNY